MQNKVLCFHAPLTSFLIFPSSGKHAWVINFLSCRAPVTRGLIFFYFSITVSALLTHKKHAPVVQFLFVGRLDCNVVKNNHKKCSVIPFIMSGALQHGLV